MTGPTDDGDHMIDADDRVPLPTEPALAGAPFEPDDGRPWGGIELVHGGRPDASEIRLWGDVDASLRDQASDVMARVVLRTGPVVIGAADVDFLDSTGLAFVLQLVKAGEEEGREVVLLDPPQHMTDLVSMVGMTDRVAVRRTVPADAG